MNIMIFVSVLASVSYIFLLYGVIRKEGDFATSSFLLWIILDTIMWRNTVCAENSPMLIGTYTICTTLFFLVLLYNQKFKWELLDTQIAVGAFILLIISLTNKATIGVIAGALAIFCAGVPNMKKMIRIKIPPKWLIIGAICFLAAPVANIIIFIFENKRMKEFYYPITGSIYWIIILRYFKRNLNYRK